MSKILKIQNWDKYWKLTIVKQALPYINPKTFKKTRKFLCKCNCGNYIETIVSRLTTWKTKSCWCLSIEKLKERRITHWMRSSRIYNIYCWILQRCNNQNHIQYKDWWWRWIKCEWNSFEEFYEDMKELYTDNLQIDRIDNDWNYCKENCRWVTNKENSRNRRSNAVYKWKCLTEWSEITWIKIGTIYSRIKYWWSIEKTLQKLLK